MDEQHAAADHENRRAGLQARGREEAVFARAAHLEIEPDEHAEGRQRHRHGRIERGERRLGKQPDAPRAERHPEQEERQSGARRRRQAERKPPARGQLQRDFSSATTRCASRRVTPASTGRSSWCRGEHAGHLCCRGRVRPRQNA